MQMTADEIVRHYQEAKSKSKDISILADLNTTDRASIRAILVDAGALQPDKRGRSAKSREQEATPERTEAVSGPASEAGVSVYDRVEQILGALPAGAGLEVRKRADSLCALLLYEDLRERLGLENESPDGQL